MAVELDTFDSKATHVEKLLKLLAHRGRLMVLCNLMEGERSAGDLEAVAKLSQSALSQHLAKLREEKIVATRRDAQRIYYRLADPRTRTVLACLTQTFGSEMNPSVDRLPEMPVNQELTKFSA
ncbi:metalloregulator ArsR/SmtB family transcription factor [Halioxenophilus sp. WMMB6]|uniref:ArsR/SmtB family transcription factor n=1 Tax=Halioxenophilus sp. WMMB6 TaxID=3073815 RepID=UPI00295ED404|nr:metalloregulator ArsR/SmtB family transcription factor [Halioxenophilus sp. WMMB6]